MSKRLVFVRQTPSGPIGRNAIRQGRLRSLHGSHPRWLHEHKMLHKNKIQVVTTHPLACHLHSFFTKSIQGYCFVNNSFFLTKHAVFCPALPECKLQQVQPCWVARCCHFLEQTFFSKTKSERGFPISFCFWRLLSFYGCKALLGATLPMATNVAKITFPRTLRDILSPQAALTTLSDVAFTIGAARCERMPCSLTPSTEFSRLNRRGM